MTDKERIKELEEALREKEELCETFQQIITKLFATLKNERDRIDIQISALERDRDCIAKLLNSVGLN